MPGSAFKSKPCSVVVSWWQVRWYGGNCLLSRLFLYYVCLVCRQNFGGEAFSASINCCDVETVNDARFCLKCVLGFAYVDSVVESSSSYAGVDNVTLCLGSRFERVFCWYPPESESIFLFPSSMAKCVTGRGCTVYCSSCMSARYFSRVCIRNVLW